METNNGLDEQAEALGRLISNAKRVVFFGGAGVSTESGIPDFRSVDGLYNRQYDYPPETILSHTFFMAKTTEFYRFYRNKMLFDPTVIRPNGAHLALARLEAQGKMDGTGVVTQNIDGLHTAAGSETVWELHGSIHRNRCMRCGRSYPLSAIAGNEGIPRCTCGGIIKPDVVLYEECLDDDVIEGAVNAIRRADLLIIGGTSMTVYPAAGLVGYFNGSRIAVINRDETGADGDADLVIRHPIAKVLEKAVK